MLETFIIVERRPHAPGQDCRTLVVESFIDGKYTKYNSNTGWVGQKEPEDDGPSEAIRLTPQAFSHFTWERTGGDKMVVDIQGVGDLYTDPQIHSIDHSTGGAGSGYGHGNLGPKGVGLFFLTHQCNDVCRKLGLQAVALAEGEREMIPSQLQDALALPMRNTTQIKTTQTIAPQNVPKSLSNLAVLYIHSGELQIHSRLKAKTAYTSAVLDAIPSEEELDELERRAKAGEIRPKPVHIAHAYVAFVSMMITRQPDQSHNHPKHQRIACYIAHMTTSAQNGYLPAITSLRTVRAQVLKNRSCWEYYKKVFKESALDVLRSFFAICQD